MAFFVLAALLWTLRSWNLEIGDGEFCCKQTIGGQAFAVTLSRSFLSYLLYRTMFFTLHPLLNWWIEDIIALSSCAAGLVFFYALYRLARVNSSNSIDFWALLLFPSTTLVLQIFCGHIEFYPWTCALLTLCTWWSWETMHGHRSPLWASAALALAAAFHSSGVFYFPILLLLPILGVERAQQATPIRKQEWKQISIILALFLIAALLHRKPTHWIYLSLTIVGIIWFTTVSSHAWRKEWMAWFKVLLPWLILFGIRALFRLRAEPLLEHIAPFREPYDHGAYLYEFISWDHLYDKTIYFLWLTPLGLLGFLGFCGLAWQKIKTDRWLLYLANGCGWALLWYIIFYPQLRLRDWDLFGSVSIPLNLFVIYAAIRLIKPIPFRTLAYVAIAMHLFISFPIILQNSSLLTGRGYVELHYDPNPVSTHAYIRGLVLGVTPLQQANIRSGNANIRVVPLERGYQSWQEDTFLEPGKTYTFEPTLEVINNRLPIFQEKSPENE